ncbi:MAG TPA: hypothetical protein VJK52_05575 [Candidatus Nanoarchaeia archaeon]|nr:hypothetical protein [Candidatus Nanoarchaeia archaeon]
MAKDGWLVVVIVLIVALFAFALVSRQQPIGSAVSFTGCVSGQCENPEVSGTPPAPAPAPAPAPTQPVKVPPSQPSPAPKPIPQPCPPELIEALGDAALYVC